MKFFTQELWDRIGSENESIRLVADKEWEQNIIEYNKQFERVKKSLTKKFLDLYLKNNEFHDFYLVGVEIIRSKLKRIPFVDFQIKVSNGQNTYEIWYKSVSNLCIHGNYSSENFDYLAYRQGVMDSWGYDEFDININNILVHEILFLSGTTFKIECSHISIKKIRISF